MHCASHICFICILTTRQIYIMLIMYFYVLFYGLLVLEKTFCEATVHEGLTKVLLGGYTTCVLFFQYKLSFVFVT